MEIKTVRAALLAAWPSGSSALPMKSDVELEQEHVAVLDDVIAAFDAVVAGFAGVAHRAALHQIAQFTVSALMNPRSKSV